MSSSNDAPVQYVYRNPETQDLQFNEPDMNDLKIDHSDTPAAMRGGAARRMLAGSLLMCMGGTLAAGLEARGVPIGSLSGEAHVHMASDPPKRVQAIEVELRLQVPSEHQKVVEKVEKMLDKGCLISRSLKPAIEVCESLIKEYT